MLGNRKIRSQKMLEKAAESKPPTNFLLDNLPILNDIKTVLLVILPSKLDIFWGVCYPSAKG
jgi:hypothetical protein